MTDILEAAGKYVGITEISGAKHNPKIVAMFKRSGNAWVEDDETPWCAAFVGAVLKDVGVNGTMKLNARSYLDYGEPVAEPKAGDIVVFWRGKKSGWQGHVAFFVRHDQAGNIVVMGGNQGDAVSVKAYSASRLLGYRRAVLPVRKAVDAPVAVAGVGVLGLGAAVAKYPDYWPYAASVAVLVVLFLVIRRIKR